MKFSRERATHGQIGRGTGSLHINISLTSENRERKVSARLFSSPCTCCYVASLLYTISFYATDADSCMIHVKHTSVVGTVDIGTRGVKRRAGGQCIDNAKKTAGCAIMYCTECACQPW